MICYVGIICEQSLMFCYKFDHLLLCTRFLPRPARQKSMKGLAVWWCCLLFGGIGLIFETLAHIWAALRSLLNKLPCIPTKLSLGKGHPSVDHDIEVIEKSTMCIAILGHSYSAFWYFYAWASLYIEWLDTKAWAIFNMWIDAFDALISDIM